MKFSIISDEVSQELPELIEFCHDFNLESLEFRTLANEQIIKIAERELLRIHETLDANGLSVCCIDSPVFKCDILADMSQQLHNLEKSFACCEALQCRFIRIFSFWRAADREANMPAVYKALEQALKLNERYPNVVMLLENGKRTMHATGTELLEVMQEFNSPRLRVLWDPGNCIFGGMDNDPIANGYPCIADYTDHVHLKDPKVFANGNKEYVPLGEGSLDIQKQLQLLQSDGYDGYVSLETHWRRQKVFQEKELDLPGGNAFSVDGAYATAHSLKYLFNLSNVAG